MGIGGGDVITNGVNAGRRPVSGKGLGFKRFRAVLHRLDEAEERMAAQVARRKHNMLDMQTIHANEAATEIVERKSKLRTAFGRFPMAQVRTKAKVGFDV